MDQPNGTERADEFLFVHALGAPVDKKAQIDSSMVSPGGTIPMPSFDNLLLYGDVAILNARNSVFVKDREGKPLIRRNRFTDVFVRRDGRWQLVSGHSSRIPEPTNK